MFVEPRLKHKQICQVTGKIRKTLELLGMDPSLRLILVDNIQSSQNQLVHACMGVCTHVCGFGCVGACACACGGQR